MKSNSLNTILQGALAFSLLLSAIFFIQYFFKSRESRQLAGQMLQFQQNRNQVNRLVAETIEYSKRNPSIDPILIQAGIKPSNAAGKPAPK